jgi:hypothetical protein
MKVEFFRLLDNHTWDTFVVELPPLAEEQEKCGSQLDDSDTGEVATTWESVSDEAFDSWIYHFIHEDLITQAQHRTAILIDVFRKDVDDKFRHCGVCGQYHPADFEDDCRDDTKRFSAGQLDEQYGPGNWTDVDEWICDQCGEEFFTDDTGVNHHWGFGIDGIDHVADADHVPYSEEHQG